MVNRKLAFLAFLLHTFSVFHCNSISCPALFVSNADPPTGICSSADLSYQTYCSFKCLTGYQLKGSEVRVCQHDKTWSGTPSTCEEIRCPKLPSVKYATVVPSICGDQSMKFYSSCTFLCPDGFTTEVAAPHIASRVLTCQLNGAWDVQVPQCHGKLRNARNSGRPTCFTNMSPL
ncbi:unnamed protein product [Porites lobata]|uniref:Sushi domain-containing protein n=1 Tax=Porites lobata TaxID=104759 RepID=A0ABN8RE91_9CNID|nr:unnamed protein product [Porites lobata]